uniref:Uncharacterized protein n=1 Tax=Knipowitschia caucasica TaxID=637954 RepID=A0AAV2JHA6_KNICA
MRMNIYGGSPKTLEQRGDQQEQRRDQQEQRRDQQEQKGDQQEQKGDQQEPRGESAPASLGKARELSMEPTVNRCSDHTEGFLFFLGTMPLSSSQVIKMLLMVTHIPIEIIFNGARTKVNVSAQMWPDVAYQPCYSALFVVPISYLCHDILSKERVDFLQTPAFATSPRPSHPR